MRRHKWSHQFLTKADETFEQQWRLGEASGMDALMGLPEMIVGDYEQQVKEMQEEEARKQEEKQDDETEE